MRVKRLNDRLITIKLVLEEDIIYINDRLITIKPVLEEDIIHIISVCAPQAGSDKSV